MNEIEEKTYKEILNELESYKLLKNVILSMVMIQILYVYLLIKNRGFSIGTIGIYILTISYFILPLIIEMLIKKSNKHISY